MSATRTLLKDKVIGLGGKAWSKHGKDRVYITCDILNVLLEELDKGAVNYGERNNKIFLDCEKNAIMRSYKGKKPTVEIQY